MDADLNFDPTQYSRLPPYLDNATSLALARQLITTSPKNPTPGVKRSTAVLARAASALGAGMAEQLGALGPFDKRPIDVAADRSWAAVELRLSAWLQLSPEDHEQVEQAALLHGQLFPEGLRFTQLEYGAQWAEADARIAMLKKTGKDALLEKLCGKPFFDELLRCHVAYGVMVGTVTSSGAPKESANLPPKPELGSLRKRVQQAILSHMIQLVAMRMAGEAAERRAAELALRPIDEYREKLVPARSPRKDEPEPSPEPAVGGEPKPA